jgi:hypothetical protein
MAPKSIDAEMRKSVNAAFDAMTEWRNSMNQTNERYAESVFSKMSEAAEAFGWPRQMVEATQAQMKQATQMQTQMIDQVMNAWQSQVQSPNPFSVSPDYMSKFQFPDFTGKGSGGPAFPGFPGFPGMPGMGEMPNMMNMFGNAPMPPVQFWMQAAEMWQKSFETAMQMWTNGQGGGGSSKGR